MAKYRLRHRKTGLYLLVENEGRPSENDVYTKESSDSSTFKSKADAVKVAKRLGLRSKEFEIE